MVKGYIFAAVAVVATTVASVDGGKQRTLLGSGEPFVLGLKPTVTGNDYCQWGNTVVPVDESEYCKNVGTLFFLGQEETCCVEPSSVSGQAQCRTLGVSNAVCPSSDQCEGSGNTIDLVVDLSVKDFNKESCCAACQCFADPHCQSFSGEQEDWAICDGRRLGPNGECLSYGQLYNQETCESVTDGFGDTCNWIGNPAPFYKTNGPCQPADPTKYPTMNMFTSYNQQFELVLALGSRGSIAEARFGGRYDSTLLASECRRAWNQQNPDLAWTNGVPSAFNYTWKLTPNGREIEWTLSSDVDNIMLSINCATQWHNGNPSPNAIASRLDINQLLDYDYQKAMEGSGYCVTNEIEMGPNVVNNPDTLAINAACGFGSRVKACNEIIDATCDENNYETLALDWCDKVFKPLGGLSEGSAAKCKALVEEDQEASRSIYVLFAQAIQFREQKYWATLVTAMTDGTYDPRDLAEQYNSGIVGTTCIAEWDYYKEVVPDECIQVFAIQVKRDSGEWYDYMKIPANQPPCSGRLNGTYEDYPELFLNEWRISECQPEPTCYKDCQPMVGFNGTVIYESDGCAITNAPTPSPIQTLPPRPPTISPTEAPTDSPTSAPTHAPTEFPTESPTSAPTHTPTEFPTEAPTNSPTHTPTEFPTESPTQSPTHTPTEFPTESPTNSPTHTPTEFPTESPTNSPTHTPTEFPTEAPTHSPTSAPQTQQPTLAPTSAPTDEPTESPTNSPTHAPTEYPTESPTHSPTFAPTPQLTVTRRPTNSPTFVPTPSITITMAPVTPPPTNPFVPPALCNSTQDNEPSVQDICSLVVLDEGYESCCGYQNSWEDDHQECRTQQTNDAWCDEADLASCSNLPPSQIKLEVDLTVATPPDDLVCCKQCQCHGDPECSSFNGTYAAWILCDGRIEKPQSCKITAAQCAKQVDQNGDECIWDNDIYQKVKNNGPLIGVYGSPCRPNLDVNSPAMTMYETDTYKNVILLGERGVITTLQLETANGVFQLEAIPCFDDGMGANPEDAWQIISGTFDGNFTFERINDELVSWRVMDPGTGILTELNCQSRIIEGLQGAPRIDVTNIVEPVVNRTGDGFCSTAEIPIGKASPLDVELNDYCNNFVGARTAQLLVDPAASAADDYIMVQRWCDLAVADQADKGECFQDIYTPGIGVHNGVWNKWLCQANNLRLATNEQLAVDDCLNIINIQGLEKYVEIYGPGYLLKYGSGDRCGTSQDDYGPRNETLHSCQTGISIEYFEAGDWHEELYIPTDFPPCGTLEITAEKHPSLFLNQVRFRQCDLDEECLLENKCEAVAGFATSIKYTGCP